MKQVTEVPTKYTNYCLQCLRYGKIIYTWYINGDEKLALKELVFFTMAFSDKGRAETTRLLLFAYTRKDRMTEHIVTSTAWGFFQRPNPYKETDGDIAIEARLPDGRYIFISEKGIIHPYDEWTIDRVHHKIGKGADHPNPEKYWQILAIPN